MNYKKVYEDLIQKRTVLQCLSESSSGCENHHIVPVSEGGSNDKDNIVRLTIKEHIFAHQLLARIYNSRAMWCAAHILMCVNQKKLGENRCLRLAALARSKMAEGKKRESLPDELRKHLSEIKMGSRNTFYGKHHSEETKKKLSDSRRGKSGYWKGKHLPIEVRQKLSKAKIGKPLLKLRGRIRLPEERQNMMLAQKMRKCVIQMDDNGNVIHEFKSIRDAERNTKVNRRCIQWCLDGKQKHAGGFIWMYKRGETNAIY